MCAGCRLSDENWAFAKGYVIGITTGMCVALLLLKAFGSLG